MVLCQEDVDGCRQAFLAFDKDRSGTIDVWELRQVLEAMGQARKRHCSFFVCVHEDGTLYHNVLSTTNLFLLSSDHINIICSHPRH